MEIACGLPWSLVTDLGQFLQLKLLIVYQTRQYEGLLFVLYACGGCIWHFDEYEGMMPKFYVHYTMIYFIIIIKFNEIMNCRNITST